MRDKSERARSGEARERGGQMEGRRTSSWMTVDLRATTIDRRRPPAANAITPGSPTGTGRRLSTRPSFASGLSPYTDHLLIPTPSAVPLI